MSNYKTLNLDELEEKIEENIALLDLASKELKRIETILKKGAFLPFEVRINNRLTFSWNIKDHRLYIHFDGDDKIALEQKARARVYAFNYLETLVKEITKKIGDNDDN